MRSFDDGKWIAKALKRDKHRETFNELHESLTYIFQVRFLLMNRLPGTPIFPCFRIFSSCQPSLAERLPYSAVATPFVDFFQVDFASLCCGYTD